MAAQTTLPAKSLGTPEPAADPSGELAPAASPVGFVRTGPVIADNEPAIVTTGSQRARWRRAVRWLVVVALVSGGIAAYVSNRLSHKPLPAGFVASNGRLEAVEIDISTKLAGRIEAVLLQEGDFVERGQVVARMDTSVLRAQLREAQADANRTRMALATAKAVVDQRRNELSLAQTVLRRSQQLVQGHFISTEKLDTDQSQVNVAAAALTAAVSQVEVAKAAVEAAGATIDRIQADIEDSVLRAPTAGRAQYRLAQPGEVLGSGGKVIGMLDLSDVYMTLFLPEESAGKLAIGAQARLVFDAAPQYVVPARISFVATEAQFTPKTVETVSERQKLVFRVKAQLDPQFLRQHWTHVKAGVPGTGYVQVDPRAAWPDTLAVHLPAP